MVAKKAVKKSVKSSKEVRKKIQPVWLDNPASRRRIQNLIDEGKSDTEIGFAFGISRSRIAPLVKFLRNG